MIDKFLSIRRKFLVRSCTPRDGSPITGTDAETKLCRISGSPTKRRPYSTSGSLMVNYFGWSLILSRYAVTRARRKGTGWNITKQLHRSPRLSTVIFTVSFLSSSSFFCLFVPARFGSICSRRLAPYFRSLKSMFSVAQQPVRVNISLEAGKSMLVSTRRKQPLKRIEIFLLESSP